MTFDADRVERLLAVRFQDKSLLQLALSHRSVGNDNNERLEFLGDSILGCVIASLLFEQFPTTDEGGLSRLRASLVNQKSLAKLAKQMNLGDVLLLGPGELKSGGYRRHSILSDALEAIIGALYLDQGFEACSDWIRRLFAEKIASLGADQVLKDPKTRLQELMQAAGQPLPNYELINTTGLAHEQTFYVQCTAAGVDEPVPAQGVSRREAEQAAASKVLARLKHDE